MRGRQIAMVFQEPARYLNPSFRVGAQITEMLGLHLGMRRREAESRAAELAGLVGLGGARRVLQAYPHELSGGMKQRAMIAMAISCNPQLLIADEPTTALDVTLQLQILRLIVRLREKFRMGILFISHDLRLVRTVADRVTVMYAGRAIETTLGARALPRGPAPVHAPPARLHPRGPEARHAPEGDPRAGAGRAGDPRGVRLPPAVPARRGAVPHRDAREPRARAGARGVLSLRGEAMAGLIEVRGLSKRHRARGLHRPGTGVLAVDRVSFSIERGSVFGLVGESGCGKTTLARAILHLDPPTSGDVLYDGVNLRELPRRALREHRRRMQIVFQDPNGALDPKMRIRDSMEEGLKNLHVPPAERRRRVQELLELVGIPAEHAARWPHEFSGGQKQRIVVARALTMDPDFLVLDEPVSNLDVSIQAQIINLLQDLRGRFDLTYLFISHDLHLVAYVSDRIGVMYRGRLVETAATAAIMARPLHPYTQRLFSSVPDALADGAAAAETSAVGEAHEARRQGGCPYCGQCGRETSRCRETEPELRDIGEGHLVACWNDPGIYCPRRRRRNIMNRSRWIIAALLAALLVLPAGALLAKDLNFALSGNPDTLDPHKTSGTLTFQTLKSVYDTLAEADKNGKIVPALAKSWTVSADSLT